MIFYLVLGWSKSSFDEDSEDKPALQSGEQHPKMDKLTRRVTGVFNSIKEALPTFEESSVDSWKTDESDIAEDKSSSQVQKSFLFSDFLVAAASSSAASPLASPMTETPRSVVNYDQFSCRHVPVTQASSSSKVGLAEITCWRISH